MARTHYARSDETIRQIAAESALYYHSIDTLCQAMATEPRYQQALDAGFGNLN